MKILVKVAIPRTLNTAISSGQGDAFCHEYDQYDNTKLTQEQVFIKKLIFYIITRDHDVQPSWNLVIS